MKHAKRAPRRMLTLTTPEPYAGDRVEVAASATLKVCNHEGDVLCVVARGEVVTLVSVPHEEHEGEYVWRYVGREYTRPPSDMVIHRPNLKARVQ